MVELRAGAFMMFIGPFLGVTEHAQLAGTVDAAVAAEAEGFDDIWIGEHHYFQCANPAAIAFAGYLLGQTTPGAGGHRDHHPAAAQPGPHRRAGGRARPPLQRPLRPRRRTRRTDAVYEVMSSMEHWEHAMPEAIDLLMQSFGGTVSADTDLYRFREVSVQPRPLHATASSGAGGLRLGGDARDRRPSRAVVPVLPRRRPGRGQRSRERVQHHAAVAAEHGHWARSSTASRSTARSPTPTRKPPASSRGPLRDTLRAVDEQFVWLREMDLLGDNTGYLDDVIANHAVGPPATCIDRLTSIVERSGVGRVLLAVESAGTPAAMLENVQRLGREVLPAVREQLRTRRHRIAATPSPLSGRAL